MKLSGWKIAGGLLIVLMVAGAIAACGGDDDDDDDDGGGTTGDIITPTPGASPISISLTSPDLEDGDEFPVDLTCDGANTSPPLIWTGVPQATQRLVLTMEDLDRNFYHWVMPNMARDRNGLAAGAGAVVDPSPSAGPMDLQQGVNSFGNAGYGGPCPPEGEEHTYRIRLYAVDSDLGFGTDATAPQVLEAVRDHVVAYGELSGTYAR